MAQQELKGDKRDRRECVNRALNEIWRGRLAAWSLRQRLAGAGMMLDELEIKGLHIWSKPPGISCVR